MNFSIEIKKKLYEFQLDAKLQSKEDIIGILGASGSGKSMLLRCIAGLVKPDEGTIIINGKTFFDSEKKINLSMRERKVGFLFQNYALFPNMTIEENIAFGLDSFSKSDKKKKVNELMEKYHLGDIENRYPAQISGGQQQRVALARAVAVEPDILLLDEPFSALDVHLRNHMIREMSESLKQYKGIALFVTHNMEEAYQLCDHIAIFNKGKVEAFNEKKNVFQHPVSMEAAKITGCKNLSKAVRLSENVMAIADWGIQLKTTVEIEYEVGFVGVRANNIRIVESCTEENCFKVWLADENEAPFRTSLFLKIGSEPENSDDFQIQCIITRDQRVKITDTTKPFFIYINPEYVFFVEK
ncbi:sulfate/molybdate ABC transporter ATP-binding protein [Acetobacterium bakii]|uniref:ABC transporter domain-containing protein n=1 Tax=Acetobacterium bakii TaxID=52689 RepID=A0A0L6U6H3_9FIRM|nr:sulfate/molybdate ABC transporter ATP-binding protein [Acetobacterium bakii]KNZ43375.1 hypothetical protein AKG39_01355 [Acetobacterium bakii]